MIWFKPVRRTGGKGAWEAGAYQNSRGGESIHKRQSLSLHGLGWSGLTVNLTDLESPRRQASVGTSVGNELDYDNEVERHTHLNCGLL